MKCTIGKWVGFCSGVQRAIKGAEKALEENSVIYCLGEIIHNPRVVDSLIRKGMAVVKDIEEVPDRTSFIIRSHGLEQDTVRRAEEKNLHIFDFTCPKVKSTHRLVANLRKEGYNLIIVGNPHHPEVKAIRSLSGSSAQVIERVQEVKGASFAEKNAVVVQTTFNPQSFSSIVSEVIRRTYKTLVCTTLCEETIKRQTEAVELAGKVNFMIVVGGKNSSNTKTLCNIVEGRVRVAHIEDADEIDTLGLHHVHRIGIISGASTPVEEVRKVYKKLQGYSQ
ncbi:MAG: hypothetical protein AMS17_00750 [Spirochaetes bacterium DG_61]|nr:MAG: hypothetical protein AMS17_00750 [Spirochaetes bacterium DG_61]